MSTTMILAAAAGGAAATVAPAAFMLSRAYTRVRELHSSLAEARYDAAHDGLTGLANRSAFYAEAASKVAARWPARRLVILVDIDNFKTINDMCGHGVGDLVLLAVAHRLRQVCGISAPVARLGGDEFAALVHHVSQTPERTGQKLRALIADEPIDVDGVSVRVSLSIGVAVLDGPGDLAVLLGRADAAMYRAKRTGTGVAVFDPILDDHTTAMPGVRADVRVRDLTLDAEVLTSGTCRVRAVH